MTAPTALSEIFSHSFVWTNAGDCDKYIGVIAEIKTRFGPCGPERAWCFVSKWMGETESKWVGETEWMIYFYAHDLDTITMIRLMV